MLRRVPVDAVERQVVVGEPAHGVLERFAAAHGPEDQLGAGFNGITQHRLGADVAADLGVFVGDAGSVKING